MMSACLNSTNCLRRQTPPRPVLFTLLVSLSLPFPHFVPRAQTATPTFCPFLPLPLSSLPYKHIVYLFMKGKRGLYHLSLPSPSHHHPLSMCTSSHVFSPLRTTSLHGSLTLFLRHTKVSDTLPKMTKDLKEGHDGNAGTKIGKGWMREEKVGKPLFFTGFPPLLPSSGLTGATEWWRDKKKLTTQDWKKRQMNGSRRMMRIRGRGLSAVHRTAQSTSERIVCVHLSIYVKYNGV